MTKYHVGTDKLETFKPNYWNAKLSIWPCGLENLETKYTILESESKSRKNTICKFMKMGRVRSKCSITVK